MERDIDEITGIIVDSAYKLHIGLGPGLLESVYQALLAQALEQRGLSVEREKVISFEFDGLKFDQGLRVDLLVENKVVVELKSTEKNVPLYGKQVMTYIRLLNLPVGLLINFGTYNFKDGIQRVVNGYTPTAKSPLRINQSPKQGS